MSKKKCAPYSFEISEKISNKSRRKVFEKKQVMIIKKASKLFIKKGYAQTSMRDISKATGMNLGGLYHYISSKEDILCLAFNAYHNLTMVFIAENRILDIEDPKEQLKSTLRRSLETAYDAKNDVLMMYRETHALPPKVMKSVLKRENELVKLFEIIIERGIKKKIFKVSDSSFAANMVVFQLSIYSLRSWNLKRYSREEYLKLTEEMILRAIIQDR